MRGNWQNILFLALVFGLPALSWIAGRIKEQAEVRKHRSSAERRASESLRSTPTVSRDASGARPVARAQPQRNMDEARRRAELEALRQRRLAELQARSTAQRGMSAAAQPMRTPGASGRATVAAAPRSPSSKLVADYAAAAQRQREQQARAQRKPKRRPPARDAKEREQIQRSSLRERMSGSTLREPDLAEAPPLKVQTTAAPSSTSALARSIAGASRDAWRQAIVMNEILNPPVSLRNEPPSG